MVERRDRDGRGIGNLSGCFSRHADGLFLVRGVEFHLVLFLFFLEVSEDVVEDKVAVGLFGQEECLGELSPWATVVGHFTNNEEDDSPSCRCLRVDRVDEDFAVVVTDGVDTFVDLLGVA